jgi:ketosteroid isomerase-like protein
MNQNVSSLESPVVVAVQAMYAAFGRGDIPALLSHLSGEVEWRLSVDLTAPGAKRIPDFRPFRGREGVQAFFSILGEELEFHSFQPLSFMTNGNEVAVRVQMELTVRSTGRRTRTESIHYFTFDADGKLARFIEYIDTLGLASAWDVVQER